MFLISPRGGVLDFSPGGVLDFSPGAFLTSPRGGVLDFSPGGGVPTCPVILIEISFKARGPVFRCHPSGVVNTRNQISPKSLLGGGGALVVYFSETPRTGWGGCSSVHSVNRLIEPER